MKTYPPQPIEVLTPQGAGLFAGRTPEAVRVAVEKGRVQTAAVVLFGAKPVPLIDLESATKFWPINDPLRERYVHDDLQEMRRCAVEFVIDAKRYRVLHPWSAVKPRPSCPHDGGYWNLDCDQPPCSPHWYKS